MCGRAPRSALRPAHAVARSEVELAGSTGVSLESVARALQTMRSLKCMETARREIRVLDVEALHRAMGLAPVSASVARGGPELRRLRVAAVEPSPHLRRDTDLISRLAEEVEAC